MRQIRLLLKTQVRKNTKRTVILIGIVLIMCMISTFSYGKNTEETAGGKIRLGVANEDASEYARLLVTYFTENENFTAYVTVTEDTREQLALRMQEGELDAYLVIPSQFAESLMSMEHVPLSAVVSPKQPTKALILRQTFEAYESYIKAVEVNCSALYDRMREENFSEQELTAANVEVSLELIFTALGKDEFFRLRTIEAEKQTTLSEQYLFQCIFFFLLFSLLPVGMELLKLRQNGMLKRLKTLRTGTGAVLVAYAILPAVGLGVILSLLLAFFGMWKAEVLMQGIALFLPVLFVLEAAGLCLSKEKDYLFLFSVLALGLAVLGGGIVPVQYLPDGFAKIAEWMPNYRFTELLGDLMEVTRV